jgi:hypothetical protein
MLLGQPSPDRVSGTRRLLDVARLDLLGQGEVSVARLLIGWIAFGVSVAMAVLLLAGA